MRGAAYSFWRIRGLPLTTPAAAGPALHGLARLWARPGQMAPKACAWITSSRRQCAALPNHWCTCLISGPAP